MKHTFHRFRQTLVVLSCTALTSLAMAQPMSTPLASFELKASTLEGADFKMDALKKKVVLVFYWSTSCGVCLSHMAELRANLVGWRGKPFELLTVNVDADMGVWRTYEHIAGQTQTVRPVSLWTANPPKGRLPVTVVIDSKGMVAARHEGRIAPEAWDAVAELML